MPITVECSCGKQLVVAEDQAGRKVRCPTCQELIKVPGSAASKDEGYGLEKTRKCPECKTECPRKAVICVKCGWNFRTQERMKTKFKLKERFVDVGVKWLGSYRRFAVERSEHGDLLLTIRRWFLFLPTGTRYVELKDYSWLYTDFTPGTDRSPDYYYLDLEGSRVPVIHLYSGSDDDKMRELIEMLQAATTLTLERR
jgi:hypothetical protein